MLTFDALLVSHAPQFLPQDFNTNWLMLLRWIHLIAGVAWVGLLYFFNLINIPFMRELDPSTKGKVVPLLMPRILWWFRWGAVATVLAGVTYWMNIGATDARNGGASAGMVFGSFFVIWTLAWLFQYLAIKMAALRGLILAVAITIVVIAAAWLFLFLNSHGWESSRLLSIGIGGGLGWFMLLNVWGVIWRAQKKLIAWTAESAKSGAAMPAEAGGLAQLVFRASRTNFYLSFPMLFFMAAASHYPMFAAG
jgi:uncharacterized membrane protein